MRTGLAAISVFTAAAACWLAVMYVVLKPPGYQLRASVAAVFALQSVLTLAVLAGAGPRWLRVVLLAAPASSPAARRSRRPSRRTSISRGSGSRLAPDSSPRAC